MFLGEFFLEVTSFAIFIRFLVKKTQGFRIMALYFRINTLYALLPLK